MGKYKTQEQIDAWRKQAGFRTTTSVIEEERRQREGVTASPISMAEAERLAGAGISGSTIEEKQLRVLEQIERNTRNNGRIG